MATFLRFRAVYPSYDVLQVSLSIECVGFTNSCLTHASLGPVLSCDIMQSMAWCSFWLAEFLGSLTAAGSHAVRRNHWSRVSKCFCALKKARVRVFRRQGRGIIKRPVNRQISVIPGDASLMLRRVVIGGFVEKLCHFREHEKTMGKAFGDP